MRAEIRIAGFGGQGTVLAGYLLGKAFSLYQGLEAVMTQSYGPEARGGASSSNIVVADREIAFPFVERADILIALSQEAYSKFKDEVQPEALVLLDTSLVTAQSGEKTLGLPATEIAEQLGHRIVANVVMLGYLCGSWDWIEAEALEKAIRTTLKAHTVELNLKAFQQGLAYAAEKEPAT
ncbi:MAG: 2-oxoacid:acceptor oxidoreductase family protein [Anaerolineales bacterium]|nr:2-oxoacid:acceptor oxidoreductase family protein [Anaerolineales bacterium]